MGDSEDAYCGCRMFSRRFQGYSRGIERRSKTFQVLLGARHYLACQRFLGGLRVIQDGVGVVSADVKNHSRRLQFV